MVSHTPLRPDTEGLAASPPQTGPTSRFDASVDRWVRGFWSWGWLTLLVLVCPGLALWPVLHGDDRDFVVKNDLSVEQRYAIIKSMIGSAFVLGLVYVGYALGRRLRGASGGLSDAARRLN